MNSSKGRRQRRQILVLKFKNLALSLSTPSPSKFEKFKTFFSTTFLRKLSAVHKYLLCLLLVVENTFYKNLIFYLLGPFRCIKAKLSSFRYLNLMKMLRVRDSCDFKRYKNGNILCDPLRNVLE